MITIEDLKMARTLKIRVEQCEESLQRLRSAVESVTPHLSAAGGSGGTPKSDKIADYVARLDEMQRKRLDAVIEYEQKLIEIDAWIATLPEAEAKVITARYLAPFYGWQRLAMQAGYSIDGAFKVHRRALKRLEKSADCGAVK